MTVFINFFAQLEPERETKEEKKNIKIKIKRKSASREKF